VGLERIPKKNEDKEEGLKRKRREVEKLEV
jgi:hypothetical protein